MAARENPGTTLEKTRAFSIVPRHRDRVTEWGGDPRETRTKQGEQGKMDAFDVEMLRLLGLRDGTSRPALTRTYQVARKTLAGVTYVAKVTVCDEGPNSDPQERFSIVALNTESGRSSGSNSFPDVATAIGTLHWPD
jgi:hypothetical protein